MNKDRRNQISEVIDEAEELQSKLDGAPDDSEREHLASQIETMIETIESIRDDEQDYYDNMPESLQGGEKGDRAQEAVSALDEAADAFGNARDAVSDEDEENWFETAANELSNGISNLSDAQG